MFDARIRPLIGPPLDAAGRWLASKGVDADSVTVAGFVVGLAGAFAIAFGLFGLALSLILASRIADGLDGAVARATRKTDRGGFLDISLDFLFYGAVPLGFAAADPAANAPAAAVLIAAFLANGSTFLAFAIMAERRGIETSAQGVKSLYYLSGLAEGGETILAFCLFCLLPAWFAPIACVFAVLCLVSAAGRILYAWKTLD